MILQSAPVRKLSTSACRKQARIPRYVRCESSTGSPPEPFLAASRKAKALQRSLADGFKKTAERVSTWAVDTWADLDQKYEIKVRIRHAKDDFERMAPHWKRRLKAFLDTPTGKAAAWALFIWSILSGVLFRVLNVFFILWWVVPLIMLPLVRANIARSNEEGSTRTRRNGFGPMGFGGGQGFNPRNARRDDDGPVIDAEWTTVDSDDSRRSRR